MFLQNNSIDWSDIITVGVVFMLLQQILELAWGQVPDMLWGVFAKNKPWLYDKVEAGSFLARVWETVKGSRE